MKTKVTIWNKILAIVAFWALIFFGPEFLKLFNLIASQPLTDEDLLYYVFILGLQSFSAYLACKTAAGYTKNQAPVLVAVNSLIAVAFFLIVSYVSFLSERYDKVISFILTIVVLIFAGVVPNLRGKKPDEQRKEED